VDSQSQDKLNALENERVHRIDANGHCAGNGAVFQLHNGAIVNRDNFTTLPMPDHVIAHLNDLAARDKRHVHPDAAMALGNLKNNVVSNDVPPREDAYLHPAVDVPREGAIVQRADVTAATDSYILQLQYPRRGTCSKWMRVSRQKRMIANQFNRMSFRRMTSLNSRKTYLRHYTIETMEAMSIERSQTGRKTYQVR